MLFSRYVIRSFFFLFSLALLFSIFLFLLFDFVDKSRYYFPTVNTDLHSVFFFYFYQIPYIALQCAPLAILFASALCLNHLSTSNEMTAMLSFGYSPRSLLKPLFICALILGVLLTLLSELVIPKSSGHVHYIRKVFFERKPSSHINKTQWSRDDYSFYSYSQYISKKKKFFGLKILTLDKNFRLLKVEKISKAYYREKEKKWLLIGTKTQKFHYDESNFHVEEQFEKNKKVTLPLSPDLLKVERRLLQELSLGELESIILRNQESGMNLLEIKMAWHTKLSHLMLSLIFIFGGFPLAFLYERRKESIFIFLKLLGVGFSYWLFFSLFRAAILAGVLSVPLGSWTPLGIISSYFLLQIRKTLKQHT